MNMTANDMNFGWIIENELAGSAIPNSMKKLKTIVKEHGIDTIITLTEDNLSKHIKNFAEQKSKLDFKHHHIPTIDGTGFYPSQFIKINKIYSKAKSEQRKVLVHCMGGYGRTSTALTGLFMYQKHIRADQAIKELTKIRPQFMITSFQYESLKAWEEYLKKEKRISD